ncbi:MAG TPA: hypothetical protein VD994_01055 [Prosthecobacter sp.]|nr:hypothetical protein [Prosthecobacter sp.]
MKAYLIPIAVASVVLALIPDTTRAQGASAVIDEALITVTNSNHSQIMAILERQLTEAERQSQRLQDQLTRMGDPRTVNVDALAMIKQDVQRSALALKTEGEQRTSLTSITGSEVFDNDAFGVMPAIGATVTTKDGTVLERDPEKYKMEAIVDAGVQDYKQVREKAVERKKEILRMLADISDQVATAEDLATVAKLQAMITLLEGQLRDCNETIAIARDDADMLDKELTNQARIISKAKQEEAALKREAEKGPASPQSTAEAAANFARGMKAPSKLPWGRKGTAGNPGTGGTGGESSGVAP